MSPSKVYIASDHAGVELKLKISKTFQGLDFVDLGPHSADSVDYPDFASKVCESLKGDENAIGILICGSGIGMSMRANRYPHIRAGLCLNEEMAELTRLHNNANVLCLGARMNNDDVNLQITEAFLRTEFEGGRHQRRLDKLNLPT